MSARVLHIVDKVTPMEFFPAVPQNFVLREGESVPPEVVLEDPDVSLYCLDDENRQALFVQTPPGVDLFRSPFYYLAQYQHAQRVIAVPYDTLHRLADGLPAGAGNLVLIYSVGRCGSTLISQSFKAVDGVLSYSEPDVYTQIAMLRHRDRSRDDEYLRLIGTCTRILRRDASTVALKFRASGIHLGDLFHRLYPDARNIFLHRHAERWLESMNAGFTPNLPGPEAEPTFTRFVMAQAPLLKPFVRRHRRQPTLTEAYALNWLSVVDKYLTLRRDGVPFLTVRYEDIKAQPRATLLDLLAYCGLRIEDFDRAYDTFSADSQEGTVLSLANRQKNPAPALSPQDYQQARAVLAEHAVIRTPDFDVCADFAAAAVQ
jgi:hypothetical protein